MAALALGCMLPCIFVFELRKGAIVVSLGSPVLGRPYSAEGLGEVSKANGAGNPVLYDGPSLLSKSILSMSWFDSYCIDVVYIF